ncbi:MAG TPA: flavin reductase family protein [Methanoregula sp.]|jgi:flavin reductase (DIM6/NTAB) family NADH-FMN oxidoreductase RutF|nr:flavin reductase family protein [Methanoregula sp.]
MGKISAGRNVFMYPMPVTLLGTLVDKKPDFMALGWVTRVNANPPTIGCGVGRHHHSVRGIEENRTFSINFPSVEMMQKTDYCGLVSGKDVDKAAIFDVYYGELTTAPMIRECPLSLECQLQSVVENPTNNFYIGEIIASYTEEKYLTDRKLDIRKINPLLLTMPDNRYWTVGACAGDAWSAGKNFKTK